MWGQVCIHHSDSTVKKVAKCACYATAAQTMGLSIYACATNSLLKGLFGSCLATGYFAGLLSAVSWGQDRGRRNATRQAEEETPMVELPSLLLPLSAPQQDYSLVWGRHCHSNVYALPPEVAAQLPGSVVNVSPDGNCFFSALATELYRLGLTDQLLLQQEIRNRAATYLEDNPALFQTYPPPLGTDPEIYLQGMRGTDWAEGSIISAATKAFNIELTLYEVSETVTGVLEMRAPMKINEPLEDMPPIEGSITLVLYRNHYQIIRAPYALTAEDERNLALGAGSW